MFHGLRIDGDLVPRTGGVGLFVSSDDGEEVQATTVLLASTLRGMSVLRFNDRGHFTSRDMQTDEFAELQDFLIQTRRKAPRP